MTEPHNSSGQPPSLRGPALRRQHLLSMLETFVLAAPPTNDAQISDELDRLLWLFAEDLVTPEEEQQMWRLVASEPGAHAHFTKMLASLGRQNNADLDTLPANLLAKLKTHSTLSVKPQATMALRQSRASLGAMAGSSLGNPMADVCIWVARQFLRPTLGAPYDFGFAANPVRGDSAEPMTSYRQQLLRRSGIYLLSLEHLGEHRVQLSLEVVLAADRFPTATVIVELRGAAGQVVESQAFREQVVRFGSLPVSEYHLAFVVDHREIDQVTVSLVAE
jgi:hypothetical protein